MSNFASIRGWIECDFDDVAGIRCIVSDHWKNSEQYCLSTEVAANYLKGWHFPLAPINWVSFVFFGANINSLAIPFVYDCILRIAQKYPEIEGYLLVTIDDQDRDIVWKMIGGNVIKS